MIKGRIKEAINCLIEDLKAEGYYDDIWDGKEYITEYVHTKYEDIEDDLKDDIISDLKNILELVEENEDK